MSHILVVEDSPTQAQEMSLLLESAGLEVEVVGDGLAALRSIRAAVPDLVVTDLMMPKMDGLALVEALRHDYPSVPVVLVTAFGSEEIAARALRAGAASYVPKRNLGLDLAATVADVLEYARVVADRQPAIRSMTRMEADFLLDNDPESVAPVVRFLEQGLASVGAWEPLEVIRVGMAVHEALINAIGHGNLELGGSSRRHGDREHQDRVDRRRGRAPYCNRKVHLAARIDLSEAVYVVRDEGRGYDPATLRDPKDPVVLVEDGGRGMHLIRTFMDEVTFNDWGNELTLRRRRQVVPCAESA